MMRRLLRLVGTTLVVAAVLLLARDLIEEWRVGALGAGLFSPGTLDELWYQLAGLPVMLPPADAPATLWERAAGWLLRQPACAVIGLLGILMLLLIPTPRRRRSFR
jgi:hypothetical protein